MKKVKLEILSAFVLFVLIGFTAARIDLPNKMIGFYWSPKKDAKIEIYFKDGKYSGKFVWAASPRKDIENPVKALQNRDVVGMEFLKGFEYDDGVYNRGEIYDPETGKTYSCKMSVEGNKLKVRGYIGISLFGRTEYFERIK